LTTYVVRRFMESILVLVGVTLVVFLLLQVAGDPAAIMLSGTGATEADLQNLRHDLGLDQPVMLRYLQLITGLVLRGDLGESLRFRRPALGIVLQRFPATRSLQLWPFLFRLSWRFRWECFRLRAPTASGTTSGGC